MAKSADPDQKPAIWVFIPDSNIDSEEEETCPKVLVDTCSTPEV